MAECPREHDCDGCILKYTYDCPLEEDEETEYI